MDTNTAKRILRSHREFIICSGNWDDEGEKLLCEAIKIAIECIERNERKEERWIIKLLETS